MPLKRQSKLDPDDQMPASVDYWLRTDGLFIFRLEVDVDPPKEVGDDPQKKAEAQRERKLGISATAKLVAQQIKRNLAEERLVHA